MYYVSYLARDIFTITLSRYRPTIGLRYCYHTTLQETSPFAIPLHREKPPSVRTKVTHDQEMSSSSPRLVGCHPPVPWAEQNARPWPRYRFTAPRKAWSHDSACYGSGARKLAQDPHSELYIYPRNWLRTIDPRLMNNSIMASPRNE